MPTGEITPTATCLRVPLPPVLLPLKQTGLLDRLHVDLGVYVGFPPAVGGFHGSLSPPVTGCSTPSINIYRKL